MGSKEGDWKTRLFSSVCLAVFKYGIGSFFIQGSSSTPKETRTDSRTDDRIEDPQLDVDLHHQLQSSDEHILTDQDVFTDQSDDEDVHSVKNLGVSDDVEFLPPIVSRVERSLTGWGKVPKDSDLSGNSSGEDD